jgi:hypothetical protein
VHKLDQVCQSKVELAVHLLAEIPGILIGFTFHLIDAIVDEDADFRVTLSDAFDLAVREIMTALAADLCHVKKAELLNDNFVMLEATHF